jgi:hypothetical protein
MIADALDRSIVFDHEPTRDSGITLRVRENLQTSVEKLASMSSNAHQNRDVLARNWCPDPQSRAGFQKLDEYIAQHDAALAEQSVEARQRRIVEAPKADRLKTDPGHIALRDRSRHANNQERMACESATDARAQRSPNVDTWQSQCDELKRTADEAAAQVRAAIQAEGIDLRDGLALGLR